MKRIWELRGLVLLLSLASVMYLQRKLTPLTWLALGLLGLYCLFRWRQAIILIFIWLTIEGFLRLWTGNNILVFFFKDAMFGAVYLGFLMEKLFLREKITFPHPINLPIFLLLVLSVAQLLNPNLLNLLVGLVGLKTLFFYIPLLYISYKLFDSKSSVYQFCFILVLVAIPIGLYALVQFLQGPSAYSRLGEAFTPWLVGYGGRGAAFNPPSTFIFIAIFGSYLMFMVLLLISVLNFNLKMLPKVICWFSFGCLLSALVVTTRRLTSALLGIQLPLMFILQRKIKTFLRLILVPSLVVIIFAFLIPGAGDIFLGRTGYMFTHPFEVVYQERLSPILHWHLPTMLSSAFIGKGIGMGSLGRRYVWSEDMRLVEMECQYAKIWYELSIWGFIIFLWLFVHLLRSSWQIYRTMDEPDLKWLALGIFMYQWSMAISGIITNILDLPLNAILLWFFSGLLLKLPLIATKNNEYKRPI